MVAWQSMLAFANRQMVVAALLLVAAFLLGAALAELHS
jgi:hypothetical protein